MKPLLLLIFVCLFMSARADIDNVVLSERSCGLLHQWVCIDSLGNAAVKDVAQKDTGFSRIKSETLNHVIDIIVPSNRQIYIQKDSIYSLCAKFADQMLQNPPAEAAGFWNNNSLQELPFGKHNISVYLQQQIFNFYYDNKVLNYLQNPTYVSLLAPKPLLKLLSDTKGKEMLTKEIQFIIRNSTCKIY